MGLLAILPLVLSGIGLGVDAYEKKQQGDAAAAAGQHQKAAADSQADLADYNASVADLQAQDAIERGQLEENKFRSGIRAIVGSQRAGFASGNVDVSFGSAVDVQGDAAYLGELDAQTIKANALREAYGYQVQAEDLRTRADIARKEGVYDAAAGDARQSAANVSAVGTLLTGGASLLTSKYGFGKKGAD